VSSKKIQKLVKGRRAPTERQQQFLAKLREFIVKSGWTQDKVARVGKISQARLNNWLRERNYPDEPNMCAVESALKIDSKSVDLVISESPGDYSKLTRAQQNALKNFDALIKSEDAEIVSHLERQIDLLWDLYLTRTGQKT